MPKKQPAKGRSRHAEQAEPDFPWPYGKPVFDWLNGLEAVLEKQADLAGVHRHGTTVGTAREFFVQRILRMVLPPMVHVGGGTIIGADGRHSRQIDVILCDPRFPVLEAVPGIRSYFVEGVIATVEVKSTLDKRALLDALDNCYSVRQCEVNLDRSQINDRINECDPRLGIHILKACGQVNAADLALSSVLAGLLPKTYVFAFDSGMRCETVTRHVQEWFNEKDEPLIGYDPCVPNVLIAGSICGVQCHRRAPDPNSVAEMARKSVWPIMSLWRPGKNADGQSHRFGLLVCDLLFATCRRLGTMHHGEQICYGPTGHFAPALVEYSTSPNRGKVHYVTCRRKPTMPDPSNLAATACRERTR
jgi:hypothetical protein